MSNIGGEFFFKCFTVMSNTGRVKKRREMKGERVNQRQFFKVFVWIITIVFKVAGADIICLSSID